MGERVDPRITFPSFDQARFHRVRACLNKLALTALFLEIPFKCLWSCVVSVGFETKTISAIKQIQTIQQNRLFVVAFHIDQWEIFFFFIRHTDRQDDIVCQCLSNQLQTCFI